MATRLRHAFRIVNWSAAALAIALLIVGKEKDYAWIAVVVLAAVSAHFIVETAALFRRARFRRRLSDTREFSRHRAILAKDLDEALTADPVVSGVAVPVVLTGTIAAAVEKKAPLSGKKAVAWRVVAEPLEGMGKVGGQVLVVDSWWGEMAVRDETGSVPLAGPGVLDGSSLVEQIFSVDSLRSALPELAPRVIDGLGIKEGKEAKSLRIALREIALFQRDKVTVYGAATRTADGLSVSGTDVLDNADSLFVRAAVRPASSRIPRRLFQTSLFAAASVVLLAVLIGFASSTVASTLFAPGGPFDPTRTGKVALDLDGRQLRVSVGSKHWDLDAGDATRGFALQTGGADFTAAASAPVKIQAVHPRVATIRNGDPDYPRWDGAEWLFEAASPAAPSAAALTSAAARVGSLYIRNLTDQPVTLRVLGADDAPLSDTSWTFSAYEAANDPKGFYLDITGKGAARVPESARLELVTGKGSHRILSVARFAHWGKSGSWLFEIVPELLAGAAGLYVKNSGELPVRIWLLGADGKPLYGDDPWSFEPKEGSSEDKGLQLQYNDTDIVMTGRETIKVETRDLATIYEGTLQRLGTWRKGAWTLDLSKAVQNN